MKPFEWKIWIAKSCWLVPLCFYVFAPFLERKVLPIPVMLLNPVLLFAIMWHCKWKLYQVKEISVARYWVDLSVFAAGVVILYCAALYVFGDTAFKNDFLYICCYLTNVPAVMSVKKMERIS